MPDSLVHALASWRLEKPQQRGIFPYWIIWFVPRNPEPFCYSDYTKISAYFLLLEIIDYFCYRRKNKHINIWKIMSNLAERYQNIFIEASELPGLTSSRLKSTPPIGAPKATETPAAAAAESTYKAKCLQTRHELFEIPSIQTGKLEIYEPASPLFSFLHSCCT